MHPELELDLSFPFPARSTMRQRTRFHSVHLSRTGGQAFPSEVSLRMRGNRRDGGNLQVKCVKCQRPGGFGRWRGRGRSCEAGSFEEKRPDTFRNQGVLSIEVRHAAGARWTTRGGSNSVHQLKRAFRVEFFAVQIPMPICCSRRAALPFARSCGETNSYFAQYA